MNPELSTELYMEYVHNHTITSLQALSFRDIAPPTKLKVFQLFDDGLSPGLAHYEFLKQLKNMCETLENADIAYMKQKADRSLTPRRPDFNRLYQSYKKEKYGERNGPVMFAQLDQLIQQYITEQSETTIQFQPYAEQPGEDDENVVVTPFILVIVTDQMKRVHKLVSKHFQISPKSESIQY